MTNNQDLFISLLAILLYVTLSYPGHGSDGLGLSAAQQILLAGPVPELVREVPVEVHTIRVLPPRSARA